MRSYAHLHRDGGRLLSEISGHEKRRAKDNEDDSTRRKLFDKVGVLHVQSASPYICTFI